MLPLHRLSFYGTRGDDLGQGSYGYVYRTTQGFAIKVIESLDGAIAYSTIREIYALSRVKSIHVLSLIDVELADDATSLVLPYMPTSLRHEMIGLNLDLRDAFRQICRGVADLHTAGILHLDLKPDNILMTSDGRVQVADLGLADINTCATPRAYSQAITRWYRPPELLQENPITSRADVWSLGVILAEMYLSRGQGRLIHLLPGDSEVHMLMLIQRLFDPIRGNWNNLILAGPEAPLDLIERMLDPNPVTRPSIYQVLADPWMDGDDAVVQPSCQHIITELTPLPVLPWSDGSIRSKWVSWVITQASNYGYTDPVIGLAIALIDATGADEVSDYHSEACLYIAACTYDPSGGVDEMLTSQAKACVLDILVRIGFNVGARTSYLMASAQIGQSLDGLPRDVWLATLYLRDDQISIDVVATGIADLARSHRSPSGNQVKIYLGQIQITNPQMDEVMASISSIFG